MSGSQSGEHITRTLLKRLHSFNLCLPKWLRTTGELFVEWQTEASKVKVEKAKAKVWNVFRDVFPLTFSAVTFLLCGGEEEAITVFIGLTAALE